MLALCWHPSRPDTIGLTLSSGEVCLCQSTSDKLWSGKGVILTTVYTHSLEPWMIAFAAPQGSQTDVLSGGDDQILQRSSVSDDGDENAGVTLWEDRRIHQAGVTAILPLTPDLIVTGSYDDHIRLISAPAAGGRRQALAEENLGGGVWRLKLLEDEAQVAASSSESETTASALSDANRYVVQNQYSFRPPPFYFVLTAVL